MSQLALRLDAPAAVVDREDPASIALEIATDLRAAEKEISALAVEVAGFDLGDEITRVMKRQSARADEDLAELRELHARILGCSVDQLDALLAADQAREKADRETARASRPAPPPRAPKGRRSAAPLVIEPSSAPTRALTERQRALLRDFEVRGNVARFSRDEQISDWAAVKDVFVTLGAKWRTGKPGGFHFAPEDDGAEKLRLAIETGEIFDPKAAGFFPTPAALADRLVLLADLRPGFRVLEPSAGKGAIALAVKRACPEAVVGCIELMPDNRAELERQGFQLLGHDFLALSPRDVAGPWDAVVMNPPFGARDDIRHIRHAATFLRPRVGRLVSVASASVMWREDELAAGFRAWVAERRGRIEALPEGSFLESGTGVRACVVVIPGEPSLTKSNEGGGE